MFTLAPLKSEAPLLTPGTAAALCVSGTSWAPEHNGDTQRGPALPIPNQSLLTLCGS